MKSFTMKRTGHMGRIRTGIGAWCWRAVALVALLFTSLQPVFGAVEVANGGFEEGAAGVMAPGWQIGKAFGRAPQGATFGIDATVGHNGKQSLKMTSEGGESQVIVMSDPITIEEGTQYSFSVYLKAQTSGTAARIMVVPSDFKGFASAPVSVSDEWKQYTVVFKGKSPALPVNLRVDLMAKGTIWIDDVVLTKGAAAAPSKAKPGAPKGKAEPLAVMDRLADGGFEQAAAGSMPAGWQIGKSFGKPSPGATFTVDATTGHDSSKSVKISSQTGEPPAILMSAPLTVEAGGQYLFSLFLKGEAPATSARIMVVPQNFKGIAQKTVSVTDQWKEYKLAFTASQGALPANVRVDLMEKGTLWVDDAAFAKLAGAAVDTGPDGAAEVADGDFEKATPGAMPGGWQIGKSYGQTPAGATFEVDSTVAHGGSKSLRIISPFVEGTPALAISNLVSVEPNETYVLSAYMKGDSKSLDAELLAWRSDYKFAERTSVTVTDTWRQYRLIFKTNDKSKAFFMRFDLADKGTLWIDDVKFTKLSDSPGENGPFIGYRYGENRGSKDVALAVHGPTGRTLPNINGICFARGFGAQELDPRFTEVKPRVVRLHNVLTHLSILKKGEDGKFTYDFSTLDKQLERILSVGAVPEVNLCFVPVEMRDNPEPAKVRGNFYLGPPSDLAKWDDYIFSIVQHCREKYPNIADWYWIFGNEPGVAQFSMGTKQEHFELYQHTVAAATKAAPNIQIGAGAFAHFAWLRNFVERCGKENVRLDLLSWHHYSLVPEDYTGKIERVRKLVAGYPSLAKTKLIIDEWNPMLPDNKPPYYSAGNYAAAHAAPTIHYMMKSGLSYHTYFIAHSPFGWGMIGAQGQKNPSFNLLKMYTLMGTEELDLSAPADDPYVSGFATRQEDGTITAMVWYAKSRNDTSSDITKSVTVSIDGVDASDSVTRYAIDREYSNGLENAQRQELETAPAATGMQAGGKGLSVQFDMPANSVSLLVIKPRK